MKTVALDVHADVSQLALVTKDGEVLLEMRVPTRPEELRRFVAGIPGPKRVVFPGASSPDVGPALMRRGGGSDVGFDPPGTAGRIRRRTEGRRGRGDVGGPDPECLDQQGRGRLGREGRRSSCDAREQSIHSGSIRTGRAAPDLAEPDALRPHVGECHHYRQERDEGSVPSMGDSMQGHEDLREEDSRRVLDPAAELGAPGASSPDVGPALSRRGGGSSRASRGDSIPWISNAFARKARWRS